MMKTPTTRDLLLGIGIGHFNATGIIPFMFMAPATTDPRSPPILQLVRHLQRTLYAMGAPIAETGMIDQPTSLVLERLIGVGWLNLTWAKVVSAVIGAKAQHVNLAPELMPASSPVAGVGGLGGMLDFLPDVPGGMITYAVGGLVAYHFWNKRKRKG